MNAAQGAPPPDPDLVGRLREHVALLTSDPRGRTLAQPEALSGHIQRLADHFTASGLQVVRQPIPGLAPAANLIAFPDGEGWRRPRLLLGAHYDTVPGTPGADDNASGVAVMLEAARLAAQSGAGSWASVAFALEEPPHFETPQQGSRVLAQALRAQGVELLGAIVLEMVGVYSDEPGSQRFPFPLGWMGYPTRGGFCALVANWSSRPLLRLLRPFVEAAGLPTETLAVPGRGRLVGAMRLSDHAAFWDAGYRALMVTDTAFYRNPRYHQPNDTADTLDYVAMARLAQGLAATLQAVSSERLGG